MALSRPVSKLPTPNDLMMTGCQMPSAALMVTVAAQTSVSSRMRPFVSTCHKDIDPTRGAEARRSSASRAASQARSSALSHFAVAGPSVSQNRPNRPSSTAGRASQMNIHCQPCRPSNPSAPSSNPEIGEPTMPEAGTDSTKSPIIRAR